MKIVLAMCLLFSFFNTNANEVISFSQNKWELLEYAGIKPNKVEFSNQSMTIRVDQSASPMFYRLQTPTVVKEIVIDAELIGALKLKNSQQGTKGNDDFSFRVGLVYQGNKRLGFLQKQIAAPWIKKLYSLAPKNIGVSHVEFFTVYQDPRLANKKQSSDLIKDNYIIAEPKNGKIKATIKVPSNQTVLALWINSDGDDTHSKFSIKLKQLSIR